MNLTELNYCEYRMRNAKECPWAWVKSIKVKILHWKMMKTVGFYFLKVNILLNSM